MKSLRLLAATCCAAVLPLSVAQAAIVFDFESVGLGTYTTVTESVSGLTASITSQSGSIDVQQPGVIPGLSGHVLLNFFSGSGPFNANFSSLVKNVSISGGDFGADTDHVFLAAYSGLNGTGTLLGSITGPPCCAVTGSSTVSLNVSGIKSVRFYSGAGDPFPGSLYFDKLTVEKAGGGVPEPATWGLMILGFGAAGATIRRRRGATAAA